jgi:hypothetical protein
MGGSNSRFPVSYADVQPQFVIPIEVEGTFVFCLAVSFGMQLMLSVLPQQQVEPWILKIFFC